MKILNLLLSIIIAGLIFYMPIGLKDYIRSIIVQQNMQDLSSISYLSLLSIRLSQLLLCGTLVIIIFQFYRWFNIEKLWGKLIFLMFGSILVGLYGFYCLSIIWKAYKFLEDYNQEWAELWFNFFPLLNYLFVSIWVAVRFYKWFDSNIKKSIPSVLLK